MGVALAGQQWSRQPGASRTRMAFEGGLACVLSEKGLARGREQPLSPFWFSWGCMGSGAAHLLLELAVRHVRLRVKAPVVDGLPHLCTRYQPDK